MKTLVGPGPKLRRMATATAGALRGTSFGLHTDGPHLRVATRNSARACTLAMNVAD
jgi:hypothetical protein